MFVICSHHSLAWSAVDSEPCDAFWYHNGHARDNRSFVNHCAMKFFLLYFVLQVNFIVLPLFKGWPLHYGICVSSFFILGKLIQIRAANWQNHCVKQLSCQLSCSLYYTFWLETSHTVQGCWIILFASLGRPCISYKMAFLGLYLCNI